MALFLALQEKPFVMVESNEEKARELYQDILFFRSINPSNIKNNIFFLPEPDNPETTGQRAELIYNLTKFDSVVLSKDALNANLWTPDELGEDALVLNLKYEISRDLFEKKLIRLGYKRVALVVENGEFSHKGWVFDIFPSSAKDPHRIEFFGDTIETIKTFDVSTQKSTDIDKELVIFPASEPDENSRYQITENRNYFYSDTDGLSDDIPENAVMLSQFSFAGEGIDAGLISMAGHGILHAERKTVYEFPDALKKISESNNVLIAASSHGQAERIKEILWEKEIIAPIISKEDAADYEGNILITIGELSSGFFINDLIVLTEKEIFGERQHFRPIKKSRVSELLNTLDDIEKGDFVVHKDHGIGKFLGIETHLLENYESDVMIIEYSGGDRLYLPLYGIEKIKKYHAEEDIFPKIDRLGGITWARTKERVRKKIKEMAERLVKLYAEREITKGFSFSPDSELHREFDDFFPYVETTDQHKAIEEIKLDMELEKPMDRLLCGDVGYGKTEVAMRAAFKAVFDNKQVALLVPTTLLCEQHFRTFTQRFAAFPVNIDYLSRFKTKKDQNETIKKVTSGDVDILIGTHTLLKKNMNFINLGLLIIDEEHKFGVAQKEKMKEIKKGVDVLILSATPIPRTLNMALSGIRGMSLIETPPEERLAVKSIVSEFREDIIRDAVVRELERKGQVFFVHNRIRDIDKIYGSINKLIPDARISVAHAQMPERHLEKIMKQFIAKEIDILVSTAIVGSGLDISNANTIIINMADRMGLADLYQLRGRVGRSNVKAYAYFLIPGKNIITNEAKKRLQAVQDMSYLGAGFRLAMKDLEIRGAGNFLGAEQSGHIHAVGFDMYVEMLENAVSEIKGIKIEEEIEPRMSLRVPAFITEEFIEDVTLRLSIYRKIASAKREEDLNSLLDEVRDRFGKLPDQVNNLFDIMRLKIAARQLRVIDMIEAGGFIKVIFSQDTKVAVNKILSLHNIYGNKIKFLEQGFQINVKNLSWAEIYSMIKKVLEKLL
ncbi:MAG: transcription-repair coupling factor [Nitrospiraceae bacterium]|nr:transcription-repair coupling factor [Nitrospiraceae bacterium]